MPHIKVKNTFRTQKNLTPSRFEGSGPVPFSHVPFGRRPSHMSWKSMLGRHFLSSRTMWSQSLDGRRCFRIKSSSSLPFFFFFNDLLTYIDYQEFMYLRVCCFLIFFLFFRKFLSHFSLFLLFCLIIMSYSPEYWSREFESSHLFMSFSFF